MRAHTLRRTIRAASMAGLALVLLAPPSGMADEGMWTYDNPPLEKLKKDHGFEPTQEWLDHLRLSSVRFNNGGSGSFVSGKGLVLTNHHVGFDCIQKLSSEETDYVEDGFVAWNMQEEASCPDLELNVLVGMEDVTERVMGAEGKDEMKARKEEIARIEKDCNDETGLRCNVVTLYGGGQYMLYSYRKHTDVRLVFAPEQQMAFFGGDFDNFTYPRHDLDFAIFRVWEGGEPYEPEHYLKWSKRGAEEGDLVFVSGNPGYSGRQLTLAQLEFQRDVAYPQRLALYGELREALIDYSEKGEEQERQAKELVFGLGNALKAYGGFIEGLENEKLMEKKAEEEEALVKEVKKDKALSKEVGGAWKDIEKAQKTHAKIAQAHLASGFRTSELLWIAQTLVRYVEEKEKPNEKRLEEFRNSNLESLEHRLYSEAPLYPGMEEVIVRTNLEHALEKLGSKDPWVKAALGGEDPADVARAICQETELLDPAFRKALVAGGVEAVEKTKDPLVRFALAVDPESRKLRETYEEDVEAVEEKAAGLIAKARFAVYGKSLPPDATFTLRLAYGTVKGYEAEGTLVPWKTTFYGLYDRWYSFGKEAPFDLPEKWVKKKDGFIMGTPLNFVSTNDIIGGNSGSPVVNEEGELVGLVFDGNIESLVWRYVYTDESERCVSVHSSAIKRALYDVYDAPHIGWELGRDGPWEPEEE